MPSIHDAYGGGVIMTDEHIKALQLLENVALALCSESDKYNDLLNDVVTLLNDAKAKL